MKQKLFSVLVALTPDKQKETDGWMYPLLQKHCTGVSVVMSDAPQLSGIFSRRLWCGRRSQRELRCVISAFHYVVSSSPLTRFSIAECLICGTSSSYKLVINYWKTPSCTERKVFLINHPRGAHTSWHFLLNSFHPDILRIHAEVRWRCNVDISFILSV